MPIRTIEYFEVSDNYSEDGRGNDIRIIGNFSTREIADKFSNGRGNWGAKASVIPRRIHICDSIQDVGVLAHQEAVEKALAKLTDEEKRLLNLHNYQK